MFVGLVVGTVVATRKSQALVGKKLLVVKPLNYPQEQCPSLVAVDTVGAGVGETVLVITGSGARTAVISQNAPVDAAIVGIVDSMEIVEKG
ncbi:MAG: EutN/CcmL family microcompartment protein [Clostridia bacterium]|nr:EutN/CcmL family microcompartment protein [Clostridia bacterium]